MPRFNYLMLLGALLLCYSCTNDGDQIISGNVAPPDPTVSNVLKENYINRTYISLIGRKPSDQEFQEGLNILNANNASVQNRNDFLDLVMAKTEYFDRLYNLARADLLNNVDTSTFTFFINLFEQELTTETNPLIISIIQQELARLQLVRAIPSGLKNGSVSIPEMHRRCLNNNVYDEINMGTENFVVSAFQNLLSRTPTSADGITTNELESSKMMVDGFQAILFLKVGDSKDDFLDILLGSNDYFESQVVAQYNRFLFRVPTSEEMSALAIEFKASNDYQAMQKSILSLDEYLGTE